MHQTYTRLVMVPVTVTVKFNEDEGFFYATALNPGPGYFARPTSMTVRSADKETAIEEALRGWGHDAPASKTG